MRIRSRLLSFAAALFVLFFLLTPANALDRHLKVGCNVGLPPFQYLDENENIVGAHIDMLQSICESHNFTFELVPNYTDQECLDALDAGKIDLILGMISNPGRKGKGYNFTDPLTSSQLCMIVPNSMPKSTQKISTAVFAPDTIEHTLLANLRVHQFIAVSNQTAVYQWHLETPSSAMIGVKDCLIYQLSADGVDNAYTIQHNYLGALEFSMVLRGSDRELLRTLNTCISELKAGQMYESICNRWLPAPTNAVEMQRILWIGSLIALVSGVVVTAYILLMRRIQRTLRQKVSEQTQQLHEANLELERQFSLLQDENDLRNRIIKYSPNGMVLVDRQYRITLINKSAKTIAGVGDAWEGKSVTDLPIFCQIMEREGKQIFERGFSIERSTLRIGTSPNSMRVFYYMIHQIVRHGDIEGVLVTVQDMTKAERLQQEAFEREKSSALTRIAAGIAHEIRNPLMTIRTFATLVGSKGDDAQVQDAFSRYVPDEVDRINRLIDNLIHYARPTKRQPSIVNLDDIVADSVALVRPILRKTGFQLSQICEARLPVLIDRDQIKQVLTNILINAIEAMEKKSASGTEHPLSLHIWAGIQAERYVVIVQDEGTGMSEEELTMCRDPFFSTKDSGTGLGLALCQQYIKENNGTMEIDSIKDAYTKITLSFERSCSDAAQSVHIG